MHWCSTGEILTVILYTNSSEYYCMCVSTLRYREWQYSVHVCRDMYGELSISMSLHCMQTEYARFDGGRFVYRINRSPMCEYMVSFIHRLKHLPEKFMMNSVLENFTILQVCVCVCVCVCVHVCVCQLFYTLSALCVYVVSTLPLQIVVWYAQHVYVITSIDHCHSLFFRPFPWRWWPTGKQKRPS